MYSNLTVTSFRTWIHLSFHLLVQWAGHFFHFALEGEKHLHKKFHRFVKTLNGLCAAFGVVSVVMGVVGTDLWLSGVVVGIALESPINVASLLNILGVVWSCWYYVKAVKHEAVHLLTMAKLNTVQYSISQAVRIPTRITGWLWVKLRNIAP